VIAGHRRIYEQTYPTFDKIDKLNDTESHE